MLREALLGGSLVMTLVLFACGDDTATVGAGGSDAGTGATGGSDGTGAAGAAGGMAGTGGMGAGVGGSGGGGGGGSGLPLGTATELTDCILPMNAPPNSLCKTLTITCDLVADEDVDLRIYPAAVTPERGTVVLGTGGLGTSFYNGQVVNALRQLGFRTVTRAWSTGWENGPDGGMARAACRYATLLDWVHEQSWAQGAMCVTGNSGGSVEISYALARFGRDAIIDFAVPTGGPPMGRLDHGCVGDMAWRTECDQLTAATACAGNVQCLYNDNNRAIIDAAYSGTPCADQDAAMAGTWLADSVVSPDAVLDYPNTPVSFIFGTQDCTIALPLGLVYANAVTSSATIDYVDAPHAVFSTAAGRAAIVGALDAGCVASP